MGSLTFAIIGWIPCLILIFLPVVRSKLKDMHRKRNLRKCEALVGKMVVVRIEPARGGVPCLILKVEDALPYSDYLKVSMVWDDGEVDSWIVDARSCLNLLTASGSTQIMGGHHAYVYWSILQDDRQLGVGSLCEAP